MSSMADATHATCLPKILIYISMSIVTARLFLPMTILLLLPLCSLLPLLLFALRGGELCPAILHWFFLTHPSMTVIAPISFLFLYLLRSYSIRYRYFLSAGLRSQGEFH